MATPLETFRQEMNRHIAGKDSFVFIIDFEMEKPRIWQTSGIDPAQVLYNFNGFTNAPAAVGSTMAALRKHPGDIEAYRSRFLHVMDRLLYGDTFLANLTIRTPVECDYTLEQLFLACSAPYKLWMKDAFLFFSPESFVRISDNRIFAYPMKGTIDASLPNARERILADKKEMAEHVTIVDLLRNDLSMIATDVRVERFRYVDKIRAKGKELLQVSSEITGLLPIYASDPAGCLLSLLPAGSVSGAPKAKTVDVIRAAEGEKRGYYTGICGRFDGTTLDTGVMIRYIEHADGKLYYRSGGGITTQSDLQSEYQEALDKIYVPVN